MARSHMPAAEGDRQPGWEVNKVAVAMLDNEGVFSRWGTDCEELLGFPAEEVTGVVTPEDLAAESYDLKKILMTVRDEGQDAREVMMLRGDSTPLFVRQFITHVSETPDTDHGYAYTCCMVDVTRRRQKEEDLRRERNRLNVLVSAMGAGLALFDENMKLRWANRRLRSWFDVENIGDQSCCEVYDVRGEDISCPLHGGPKDRPPFNVTTERVDATGQWRCYLHVVTDVDIGHDRYLVLTTDITRQRRHREQVQMIDRMSRFLQASLDLDRILYLTLVCVTAGHALDFSRAFIFLLSPEERRLRGMRGAGPISEEEAERIWARVKEGDEGEPEENRCVSGAHQGDLTEKVRELNVPVDGLCQKVIRSREPRIVQEAESEETLNEELRKRLELEECLFVPLVSRDTPQGLMIADNRVSGNPLDEESIKQLQVFATQASMAIANARAYEEVQQHVRDLEKTQEKLLESERLASVGRMAARMAHQMRTPLASIGGYAQAIMRAAPDDSNLYGNARVIYEEEQTLEAEVNETLELSRPVKTEETETDFNELVRETVDRFFCERRKNNVELSVSLSDDVGTVSVDPSLIHQVINNLLENAAHAVQNQPLRRVRVRTRSNDDSVQLLVTDTGQGIDEKTREKMFAPFYTTKKNGTGLGLAIARRIVRKHGGKLWCRTRRGKGATFGVKLPLGVEEGDI